MSDQTPAPKVVKQPTQRISGTCLCGACKYTVDNEPLFANICHCLSCKKRTGSAFVSNVWFSKSGFVLEGTTSEHLRCYSDSKTHSGRTIDHYFCGTCGSSVYSDAAHASDRVPVSSGTIDGPVGEALPENEEERLKGMSPGLELFCKRKAPWVDVSSTKHQHQEMPGSQM